MGCAWRRARHKRHYDQCIDVTFAPQHFARAFQEPVADIQKLQALFQQVGLGRDRLYVVIQKDIFAKGPSIRKMVGRGSGDRIYQGAESKGTLRNVL